VDEALFRGRAMTYYGRWTYKYESARAKGAEGLARLEALREPARST
jgi:hypothetical protein